MFAPGLCKGSLFDTRYSWTRETRSDFYMFSGYTDAVIEFSKASSSWQIKLYSTNETFAVANATMDYPFGSHVWTLHNDPCFGGGTVVKTLNLNSCKDSEFNCADGQCVPMDDRCDGVIGCDDTSGKVKNDPNPPLI